MQWALPLVLASAILICGHASAYAKAPLAILGDKKIQLEVAQTPAEIARGLMYRTDLPEYSGMVFLFQPPRKVRFWMKNCLISLDMLFIANGKIIKICHSVPPCKAARDEDCPLYPESGEIEASEVLELQSGYAKRHGVKEGDSISFQLPATFTK